MKPVYTITLALGLLAVHGALAAPAPTQPLPSLQDIDGQWRTLLEGDVQGAVDAYDVLPKFYDDKGIAAGCMALLPDLDRAIGRVPVAISLWRAGERCAREHKEEALANRYGDGVSALAAHALARDSSGPWDEPIRVLNVNDAFELINATGMELLYRYGEANPSSRYLRLYAALEDPEDGIERHLSFDMLEPLYHVRNDDELNGYPGYRRTLRDVLVNSLAQGNDEVGKDLQATDRSRFEQDPAKRVGLLRESARAGGIHSMATWLAVCAQGGFKGCSDGLVDAILPFAEQDAAMYRVQLALAYALGIGVDKDTDAAVVLLDSADKRWPRDAYAAFAEQWLQISQEPPPAKVMAKLEADGRAGGLRAGAMYVYLATRGNKEPKLDAGQLALAKSLAAAGNRGGRELLYMHYLASGDEVALRAVLDAGVAAGDPAAQRRLARRLFDGKDVAAQAARAQELMRSAAHAGETEAMRWLGGLARNREQWKEAESWFQSALQFEDELAIDGLLELYAKPRPGLSRGPKEALQLYTRLESKLDTPAFRRSFSAFLQQAPEPRDLERARKLLQVDAEKGDEQSQYLLGIALLDGKFGKVERKEGAAWVEKAMASGKDARDAYAHYLYYRERSGEARSRALAIERALVKEKHEGAMNNLAWWLCTSGDSALRNAVEGLEVAKALGPEDELRPAVLDTLAACEAAAGQFDSAARHQQLVVDHFRAAPSRTTPLSRFVGRLDRYRQGQAYVEAREDEPAVD